LLNLENTHSQKKKKKKDCERASVRERAYIYTHKFSLSLLLYCAVRGYATYRA
jgi:hypothetical protein